MKCGKYCAILLSRDMKKTTKTKQKQSHNLDSVIPQVARVTTDFGQ